ncbi:MAG: hypothetical protein ACT4P5_14625 [Armatimonadota bacterium]
MMRDVFKQVLEQPDIEIVGELDDPFGLLLEAGRAQADVVILGLHDAEFPGVCTHLLTEYPHIKILGITKDGRRAFLYELRPRKVVVGEVSPQGLLTAIRSAVQAQGV